MKLASAVVSLLLVGLAAEATKVSVKNLNSGQVYNLDVDVNEKVLDFKHQVEAQKGAPEALKQVLIFGGRSLENGQTLGHYLVEEGSQLELAGCKHVAPGHRLQVLPGGTTGVEASNKVFVKYLKTAISLPVDIELTGTVRSLKLEIQKRSHVWAADTQVLLSGHQLLDDEQTLEHYNIKDGATVDLGVCVH